MAPTATSTSRPKRRWAPWRRRPAGSTLDGLRPEEHERPRWVAISMSVLISALLWFSFTMTERYTVAVDLPTRVDYLPADQALTAIPPATIRVQLQGEGFQIFRLKYTRPVVSLNASLDEIDVRQAIPELPKNVTVQMVSPQSIRLDKGHRVVRRLPVRLRADLEMPPTHDLLEPPRIEPDSVLVTGARAVVGKLAFWPTERLVYQGLRDSVRVRVALADTLHGLVSVDHAFVDVSAVAREFTEGSREIDVTVRGLPSSGEILALDPPTVRVRYRVLFADYFEAARAPDFYAEIPYHVIRSDTTGRIRPILHLPADLDIRDYELVPPVVSYYWKVGQ